MPNEKTIQPISSRLMEKQMELQGNYLQPIPTFLTKGPASFIQWKWEIMLTISTFICITKNGLLVNLE